MGILAGVPSCNSWGKFWEKTTLAVPSGADLSTTLLSSGFAPAANQFYTIRSGFLIGTIPKPANADSLEYSFDGADFKVANSLTNFKIPLPTGSATWRLDSRHIISFRLRNAAGPSSSVSFGLRKGNNRDINGDGYADLVVGADQYSTLRGRAYIFLSKGATGIATQNAATADAIITGENNNDLFGISVAMDDVNGDGYADVVVGANQYPSGGGNGRVYVIYSSGTNGISTQSAGTAGITKIDGRAGSTCNLGYSVATGDVNGDGFADVVGGAYLDGFSGAANDGHVYIFHSSGTAGIAITSATSASTDLRGENVATGKFGNAVALGDFNGDGFADLVVGAPFHVTNTGRAYILNSSASGIASQLITPANAILGAATLVSFGNFVATGDFNGDGYTDFASGGHGTAPTNTGAAFLFLSQPNFTTGPAVTTATASFSLTGQAMSDAFGFSVSFGDVNGDGKQDLFAHAQQTGGNSKGYMFHSQNGAISGSSASGANTIITGEGNPDFFGAYSVVYDVNADGYDDLIAGAYQYSLANNTGRVYIYLSPGKNGISGGAAATASAILTGEATATRFGRAMPF